MDELIFGQLIKIETSAKPLFLWKINQTYIELTPHQIMNQNLVQKKILTRLNYWCPTLSAGDWEALVRDHLTRIEVYSI